MNYNKFTDGELMDSYQTQMDYSQKADKDILEEIERRGGLESLQQKLLMLESRENEVKRIRSLALRLHKIGHYPEEIISQITSTELSENQIRSVCEEAIIAYKHHIQNTAISQRTIIGCVVGVLISAALEAFIWYELLIQSGRIFFLVFGLTTPLSYLIIRLLTRQNRQNVLVYIATILATGLGFVSALLFFRQ